MLLHSPSLLGSRVRLFAVVDVDVDVVGDRGKQLLWMLSTEAYCVSTIASDDVDV